MRLHAFVVIASTLAAVPNALALQCDAVLNKVYNTTARYSAFDYAQSFRNDVCDARFETYESARESSQRVGIDVPTYFSGRYGSRTDASNYSERRSHFCQQTAAQLTQAMTESERNEFIETATLRAWETCVSTSTRSFSIAVTPGSNNANFRVRIAKRDPVNNAFIIRGWTIRPQHPTARCQIVGRSASATSSGSDPHRGDATLVCEKEANSTVAFAISTDSGDFDTELIGTDDELRAVRASLAQLRSQVEILSANQVPAGSIAAMSLPACPRGWSVADGMEGRPDLRGRFPLGVGTLQDGSEVALRSRGGSSRFRLGALWNAANCCSGDLTMYGFAIEWDGEGETSFRNPGNNSQVPDAWYKSPWRTHMPPYTAVLYCVKN